MVEVTEVSLSLVHPGNGGLVGSVSSAFVLPRGPSLRGALSSTITIVRTGKGKCSEICTGFSFHMGTLSGPNGSRGLSWLPRDREGQSCHTVESQNHVVIAPTADPCFTTSTLLLPHGGISYILWLFPVFITIMLRALTLASKNLSCFLLVPKLGSHLFRKM